MTLYLGGESPAEFVARMRAEHGLPPKCDDAAILGRIARELVDGQGDVGDRAHTRQDPGHRKPGSCNQPTDHPSAKEAINAETT